jgi:AcrR family transcriptional regulator
MLKENRKKYHHGDLKHALIEAGLAELEERGLDALSLRSIAGRVGRQPHGAQESLRRVCAGC